MSCVQLFFESGVGPFFWDCIGGLGELAGVSVTAQGDVNGARSEIQPSKSWVGAAYFLDGAGHI